jgi:hypothetical protein
MSEALLGSAEFRIFRQALRDNPEDRHALAKEISSGTCDWSRILEGARRHRVEHALLTGLRGLELPPVGFIKDLREAAREASRNSLMQMREIARLATAFRRAGVPIIALKGVALSIQTGRDPAHRNSRDIDLLIPSDGLAASDTIMRASGYGTEVQDVSAMAANYLLWNKEVKYFHPETHTLVELHYRLVDNSAFLHIEFDELWQEHELVTIAGVNVAVMPRRHLPIYLCAHGAAHAWERLCWLVDFTAAMSIGRGTAEDVELAAARGVEAPMLHALLLAHTWLGWAIDEKQLVRANSNRRVARLNAFLNRSYGLKTWFRSPPRSSLAGFLRYSIWLRCYVYSLKPDWQFRKRQIARELIAPADWDTFRLPPYLAWVYPFLRPIGWIVRRFAGTA